MKQQVLGSPSGSVGPYVTSRNRAGSYQRNRVIPLNPESPEQEKVRGIFAAMGPAWRGLTDTMRNAWAALRDQVSPTISAYNMFAQVQCNQLKAGLTMLTAPPPLPPFGLMTVGVLTASFASGACTLALASLASTTTGAKYKVEGAPPCSAGKGSLKNKFTVLSYESSIADGLIETSISLLMNIFGFLICSYWKP
jgi:hypothetical protein